MASTTYCVHIPCFLVVMCFLVESLVRMQPHQVYAWAGHGGYKRIHWTSGSGLNLTVYGALTQQNNVLVVLHSRAFPLCPASKLEPCRKPHYLTITHNS